MSGTSSAPRYGWPANMRRRLLRTPRAEAVARCVPLVALIGSVSCQLGDLVNEPPAGTLSTSVSAFTDSAAVGSKAVVSREITISGSGRQVQSWRATQAVAASWLRLSADNGSIPANITATLDPIGLAPGVYNDTIVVAAVGGAAAPVRIPVAFTIHPCSIEAFALGSVVSDSIARSDCASPTAPDHFAKLFRVSIPPDDSVSLLLTTNGFDGVIRVDSLADATGPPLVEENRCSIPSIDVCLIYLQLPARPSYLVQVSTTDADRTGAFTLSVATPQPPSMPTNLDQRLPDGTTPIGPGASLTDTVVVLAAVLSDPDPTDRLTLEVEVRPTDVAFSSAPTAIAEAVPNGETGTAIETGLADDTDYHWQGRVVDETGRSSPWVPFGPTAGAADFRVAVPDAPNLPSVLRQMKTDLTTVLAVGDTTTEQTVLFTAVLSDDDPGDMLRLETEVRLLGTPFSDRAVGSSVQVESGNVATVTITGLSDDADYHWQARAIDALGNASGWVPFGDNDELEVDFRVAVPGSPVPPTELLQFRPDGITSIPVGETIDEHAVVLKALVADPDEGDLVRLQVAVQPTASAFTNSPTHTSPEVGSGAVASVTVSGLADDTDYHWRARTIDQGGSTSGWVSFGGNADAEVDFGVAVPATALVFSTQPSNSTAGSAIVPAVVVTAHEPSGTTDTSFAQTVSVSLSPGAGPAGATLAGVTSTTPAGGVATFSNLSIDLAGTGYRLSATADGLTAESDAFEIESASAGRLVFATPPPTTAQSGSPLSTQPVLQLEDSIGNPVSQAGVEVTAAIVSGPGGSLTGASATTDAQGVATFGALAMTGLVGDYELQFSAAGVGSVTSDPITLGPGPAVRLALATQPASAAQNGVTLTRQPVVQLEDEGGNAVGPAGIDVAVAIDSGGGMLGGTTTSTTDAGGVAAFTDLVISGSTGDRVLEFSSPGLDPARSSPVTVSAGPATTIDINDGNNQSAAAGTAVAVPPSVVVSDANGNRVSGVNVTFSVATGGGSVTPATAVGTDDEGIARVSSWTLGSIAGTNTLEADVPGLGNSPVTFTATATPGAAGVLAIASQPSASAQSGVLFAQQPTVQVQDANGNDVAQAGVEITAALASGPVGTLQGDVSALTDATGLASFTDLRIAGSTGNYTLSFSGTGLSGAISDTVSVTPGVPSQLGLTVQPPDAPRNAIPFAQQPVVQVRDASGNAVAQSGVNVTVAILSGGGALGGTTTAATDGTGAAVFTDLSLTGTVGDRTLVFSASGLQSVVSNTLSLQAGDAVALVLGNQLPTSINNAVQFSPQPRVELRDVSTNSVGDSGVSVTASIASGGGALGGTVTVATNAAGVAVFTDLVVTGTVGPRTLAFDSPGLTQAVSDTMQLLAGPAARVGISQQPAAVATNGVVLSQQPVVEVQDVSGNRISNGGGRGDGVPITASIVTGQGTLSGTTTVVSASGGVGTYTDLVITGLVGTYVLEFTSPGLTSVSSTDIVLEAGAATKLVLTTQPSDTAQVGAPFARQPVVQVSDQSGNAVAESGLDVAAAILSGGGTLSGTTPVTTDSNGVAAFTDLAIVGLPGDRVLIFAAGSLQAVSSNTITVTP